MDQLQQYIVLFWLLPVLVQIVLPLLLFALHLPKFVMGEKTDSTYAIPRESIP